MQTLSIETADDPRIRDFRHLSDGDFLAGHGWFVAEGRLVAARVLDDPRYRVRSLLLNPAALSALGPSLARLPAGTPIYVCRSADFLGITGFNIHRGCLAIVERPTERSPHDLIATARAVAVLEAVANADNIGGVFRNAAAFGVDAVLLGPACGDPLYRKAVRTSMGAVLRVPFARLEPWPDALDALTARGFTTVALTPAADAQTLDAFAAGARSSRLALLFGAEGSGLTREALARATHRVRIPTRPEVDSLNLAVAAGIAFSRLLADVTV
jgi:tRNA G18 (ribose-2'-O)-methylase SpoU